MRISWCIQLLFLFVFCQTSQAQGLKGWNQLDSIKDHREAISKLTNYKNTLQKLSKEDELSFERRVGFHYIFLSKFDSSLIHVNKAIELARELSEDSILASMYKTKGNNYYYLTKKAKAFEYWQKALKISEKQGYDELTSGILANVAAYQIENNDLNTAIKTLLKSIEINERLGQHLCQRNLLALRLLGTSYQGQKKYEKAMPVFEKLTKDCRLVNDSMALSSSLVFHAINLSELGQKKKAYALIDEALAIQRKMWEKQGLIATLMHYAEILKKEGRYQEALDKTLEAYELKGELFLEQLAESTSDAEVKYQTDSIAQRGKIADLQNKESLQALIISENQQSKMRLLVIIISISAFLIFLLYYLYQIRNQARTEAIQREELLNALIQGEEKERERIAKDLHDGIVQDLTAFKFELSNIASTISGVNPKQFELLGTEVGRISNGVRELSYQMMPLTLKELGLLKALQELLNRSLVRQGIEVELNSFGFTNRLSEKIETAVYRIVQELINNTIKHSQASHVSLLLQIRGKVLQLTFEDNGVGFDPLFVQKGIGLNSLESRIKLVKGTIDFESTNLSKGTTVYIRIPIV